MNSANRLHLRQKHRHRRLQISAVLARWNVSTTNMFAKTTLQNLGHKAIDGATGHSDPLPHGRAVRLLLEFFCQRFDRPLDPPYMRNQRSFALDGMWHRALVDCFSWEGETAVGAWLAASAS